MSRLSIYETRWIDLIFENRNQEYGAYQLRRESVKSSLTALFMGLLLVASIGVISSISNYINPTPSSENLIPIESDPLIQVTEVDLRPKTPKNNHPATTTAVSQAPVTTETLRNPIVVNPEDASPKVPTNQESLNTPAETSTGTGPVGLGTPGSGDGSGTDSTGAKTDYGTSIVNTSVLDKLPAFPGGMEQFYKYISTNFEKPDIDETNIFKIYVYFVIEKDGSLTDIRVQKDPGYGLGREAVRVLKSIRTKWSPGTIDSKPVRTAYNLPITVQMN